MAAAVTTAMVAAIRVRTGMVLRGRSRAGPAGSGAGSVVVGPVVAPVVVGRSSIAVIIAHPVVVVVELLWRGRHHADRAVAGARRRRRPRSTAVALVRERSEAPGPRAVAVGGSSGRSSTLPMITGRLRSGAGASGATRTPATNATSGSVSTVASRALRFRT